MRTPNTIIVIKTVEADHAIATDQNGVQFWSGRISEVADNVTTWNAAGKRVSVVTR